MPEVGNEDLILMIVFAAAGEDVGTLLTNAEVRIGGLGEADVSWFRFSTWRT